MEKRVERSGYDVTFNSPGDGDCFYASTAKALGVDAITEMLSLILQENSFHFNGKDFLQSHGTVMCTKMTVAFANIFMAKIENTIPIHEKPNTHVLDLLRFIDNIISMWDTETK